MYEIILSPESREDLNNIKLYISCDNIIIAEKVINKIFHTLSNISTFPSIGKEINNNLRELVEPNYKFRIIYIIKKEHIEIISISKNKNLF